MSRRAVGDMRTAWALIAVCAAAVVVGARPVRRTLGLRLVVVGEGPARLVAGDGVARFGPLLEYLVQRAQGLLSVRNNVTAVGGALLTAARAPGVYDLHIPVTIDDGIPL